MESGIMWTITGLLLTVGVVGSIVPAIPGPFVILGAAVLHAWWAGWETVGVNTLIFLAVMTAGLQVADYLAGAYGAKKLGGTRAGMIGSVIGSLIGLVTMGFIGLAVGCFVGAAVGEMAFASQGLGDSLKVGFGSLLGLLASTAIRVVASLVMVIVFLYSAL